MDIKDTLGRVIIDDPTVWEHTSVEVVMQGTAKNRGLDCGVHLIMNAELFLAAMASVPKFTITKVNFVSIPPAEQKQQSLKLFMLHSGDEARVLAKPATTKGAEARVLAKPATTKPKSKMSKVKAVKTVDAQFYVGQVVSYCHELHPWMKKSKKASEYEKVANMVLSGRISGKQNGGFCICWFDTGINDVPCVSESEILAGIKYHADFIRIQKNSVSRHLFWDVLCSSKKEVPQQFGCSEGGEWELLNDHPNVTPEQYRTVNEEFRKVSDVEDMQGAYFEAGVEMNPPEGLFEHGQKAQCPMKDVPDQRYKDLFEHSASSYFSRTCRWCSGTKWSNKRTNI